MVTVAGHVRCGDGGCQAVLRNQRTMPQIGVVIPVYKAEACLEELYRRLKAALEPITDDLEILLIEACWGDRSWPMIVDLARRDPRVKGLQFSRNFGQHY